MIKIFKHLNAKEWVILLISTALIFAQVWLDLRIPEYMSEMTIMISTAGAEVIDVLSIGGKMLGCALLSLSLACIVGFFVARIAARLSLVLRSKLFAKVESFSLEEINNFSTSSLITRSTNDINQIQIIVAMGVQIVLKAPFMAIIALTKMQNSAVAEWTYLTVIVVCLLLASISVMLVYTMPKFRKVQRLTDNLNRVARENLTGLKVVRAYNAEQYQENQFATANNEFTKNNLQAQRVMALFNPMMGCVMNIISLGIYWIGAFAIAELAPMDRIETYANMMIFTQYSMLVVIAFTMVTMIIVMLPRAAVAAKRVSEVLETEVKLKEGNVPNNQEEKGTIEFKNVYFKYPNAEDYVLEDISFKVARGETIAFIGATGSGKTTILHMLTRFYDVTKGEVLVDGVNVKEYTFEALYQKLGIVPQKANLFTGTIEENLNFGDNKGSGDTVANMERAAKIAQSYDFISAKRSKFDSMVAQGGKNFSGGQQQRLSIARAVARNPEILIFDDSFSALDYKTDRILRSTLKSEISDVTNVIVGQRIGTIKEADQIAVIDEGKIVGLGTHESLLGTCEVYKEIALSQLSKEEL